MSQLLKLCVTLLLVGCITIPSYSADAGVVFMKTIGQHLYHENVPPDAVHNYYTTLEGPTWENKYCCWRTYLDQDNRNCIDITGKKKFEPTLAHYDESNADVHAEHDWGTDILKVGSTLGIGAFRIQYGDEIWRNPQLGIDIDSLVVEMIDTTYESPKFQMAYWGWQITSSAKIDVFWTIETKKDMRSTMCELKIDGPLNNTRVVVGMVKNSGVLHIEDQVNHNLITLGIQTEKNDSLMMAIHADEEYFNGFSSNNANYAMILNLDDNQITKWAFTNSWVQEPNPLFRNPDWQDSLFNDLPAPTGMVFKNKNDFFMKTQSSSLRTGTGEPTLYNLAGKLVSGMNISHHNSNKLNHLSRGFYIARVRKGYRENHNTSSIILKR